MNFVSVASTYIAGNVILFVAFVLIAAVVLTLRVLRAPLRSGVELHLHYFTFAVVIGLLCVHPFLPKKDIFSPVAKVWAAESAKRFAANSATGSDQGYISVSNSIPRMFGVDTANHLVGTFALCVVVLGLLRLAYDLFRLIRVRSRSFLVRRILGVRVWVSEEIHVPFSFWLPGQKNIVMPNSLLGWPEYRIALLHEIQHHRQQDTKWVYLIWGLRLVFILNPVVHLWNRWICEVQEFACDDAVVGRPGIETHAYASCLIQVAQSALQHERQPVCATGLTFLVDRQTLKRRIKSMLQGSKHRLGWTAAIPIAVGMAIALGVTTYAAQGFVQDRRVTMSQAEALSKTALSEDGFPVVVNDRVVKWLNYFVGTPDGREQVRAALARMENYRNPIQKRLDQYQLPSELMAIPLIESGYKNLDPKQNPSSGAAGLWQIIATTAGNFGLNVTPVDERLDVDLSSDAALRLLLADKLRFNDWLLSILAYNGGEKSVQEAINKTGSRDAWALIRSGLLSKETEEYVPKLMAAILVMRNSSALL